MSIDVKLINSGLLGNYVATFNLCVPEMVWMIINNEPHAFSIRQDSETTKSLKEEEFCKRWSDLIRSRIRTTKQHQEYNPLVINDLTEYGVGIFSTSVKGIYAQTWNELSIMLSKVENTIEKLKMDNSLFSEKVAKDLFLFLEQMEPYCSKLENISDRSGVSLFNRRFRSAEFGENFCFSNKATFNYLSYALDMAVHPKFDLKPPKGGKQNGFYVPEVVLKTNLKTEWILDLADMEEIYPKGMFLEIHERGTVDDFVKFCDLKFSL